MLTGEKGMIKFGKVDRRPFNIDRGRIQDRIGRRKFFNQSALALAAATISGLSGKNTQALSETSSLSEYTGTRSIGGTRAGGASVLLDMIRLNGNVGTHLESYLETTARPLLDQNLSSSVNVYHLRQQNEPASSLGDRICFAVYQLTETDSVFTFANKSQNQKNHWHRVGLTSYEKIAECGRPTPIAKPPESIMLVISHPTEAGYDGLYNQWYTDNHMIDVAKSPHFRSATRYRPQVQLVGLPLSYLCIYEIEQSYSPELHKGLTHWLSETPDDFRQTMPLTESGQGVLTLDIWGYCQRVWAA